MQLIEGGRTLGTELFSTAPETRWEQIADKEFDGCNLFAAARMIGIRKFRKGFWTTPGGESMGYNIPVRQNALTESWRPKPDENNPKYFGYYKVRSVGDEPDHPVDRGLLLDYGQGSNPFRNFTWVLRDYLRQPYAEDPDIVLGAAYIKIGAIRFFSNFFALRAVGATTRSGPR